MQNYDKKYKNKFGNIHYYLNDRLHRTDGPAVEDSDGARYYYIHGKYHREGGPAVEYICGGKKYYINGKLHRENGPAVIDAPLNVCKYYIDGELHRIDGPAVHDLDDPDSGKQFWIDDIKIKVEATEEFLRYVKLSMFI